MHRCTWIPLAAFFASGLPLLGQVSQVSIATEPAGVMYVVDGRTYYSASTFAWPKGSKHTLEMPFRACGAVPEQGGYQYDVSCQVRYSGPSWSNNLGPIAVTGNPVVVTADPSITSIKLTATAEYRVTVALPVQGGPNVQPVKLPHHPCIGGPVSGAPGIACVAGACYDQAVELWLGGGPIELQAFANSGFAFDHWSASGTVLTSPHTTVTLNGPASITPRFRVAKRVRVMTDPPELKVLVDRQEVRTIGDPANYQGVCPLPGYFDFLPDSVHVFGALSPQMGETAYAPVGVWMFDKWSNGGVQNMVYRAGTDVSVVDTLVAQFVRGVQVNFNVPRGLKLIIDGRDNWPINTFVWAAGSKHVISAPAEQFDQNGRKYVFKGWSHGGDPMQEILIDGDPDYRMTYTAQYELQGMLLVQSETRGASVEIDGSACQTPCTVHRPVGTTLRVSAPQSLPVSDGERLDFQGWTDAPAPQRSVELGSEPVLLGLSYRTMYRLDARSEPARSATIRMEPAASDGYYPRNARVQVFSTARTGYKFKGWRGDVYGMFSPVTVDLGGPRTAVAVYEAVPHIAPAGVRNAAAETPEAGVAAGSVISIFGGLLAERTEAAPEQNRLSQSLGGSTVLVGGSVLPLFLASPEQINAQLPADLPEGTHTLRVRNSSQPEPITAEFTVVRNAPGLFTADEDGMIKAMATGPDGKLIGVSNPARPGDIVTLLGTGFGPHSVAPPEGFGVQERAEYRLADPVEVVIGETVIAPEYAGAGASVPGMVVVRFRLPRDLPPVNQELFVRVNGVTSNKAWLVLSPPNSGIPLSEGEQQ